MVDKSIKNTSESYYELIKPFFPKLTREQEEKIITNAGYPLLSQLTIDNEKLNHAINTITQWVNDQKAGPSKQSLLLSSPPTAITSGFGVGKTTLARAAAFMAYGCITIKAGLSNESHENIIKLSKAELNGTFYTEQAAMKSVREERYPQKGVIIIDDIGRGGSIEFIAKDEQKAERQNRYFLLVDHCYRHNLPMILTMNLTKMQFIDCIGQATWSRVAEMIGPTRLINLSGLPDYREKIGGW